MVPDASVKMTDISEQALATAMKNAELNGVLERSSFALGNMFSALRSDEQFDIIVSNPPYIKSDIIETLAPEVKDHEPRLALDGGEDGLDAYKVIANNAAAHLKDGGVPIAEDAVKDYTSKVEKFDVINAVLALLSLLIARNTRPSRQPSKTVPMPSI